MELHSEEYWQQFERMLQRAAFMLKMQRRKDMWDRRQKTIDELKRISGVIK